MKGGIDRDGEILIHRQYFALDKVYFISADYTGHRILPVLHKLHRVYCTFGSELPVYPQ